MCIILGEVYNVSKTKLFVLPNKDKSRQMTFYSNVVGTPQQNMMILPVPCGSSHPQNDGQIELHQIHYKGMFDDLKRSVKSIYRESASMYTSRGLSLSASVQRDTLEVFDHGSYLVSIAPQIEDLLRLDTTLFEFTPELFEFFAKHYTREFSYICCVLKPGTKDYEPLCYSHPIHSSNKLFVPTLHYHTHGGEVHTEHADWDHLIYSVNTEEKANRGYTSNYSNNVNWSKFPPEFRKLPVSSVRCAEIKGNYPNKDISFGLY
jgi:hypothetical protein